MAIARQRPATANGIVFMLLEDEHGLMNLVVQPEVYERHRALVRGEPLLAARGRLEKVGLNINVVVTELQSLGLRSRASSLVSRRCGLSAAQGAPLRSQIIVRCAPPSPCSATLPI